MQKLPAVFLTIALLLVSSGFASSQNRFKHGTVLKPISHGRPAQATPPKGHHPGSTKDNQKNGLHQNLERRNSNAAHR